jgi:hypothetical protein
MNEINYLTMAQFAKKAGKQLPITSKKAWSNIIQDNKEILEILDPIVRESGRGKEFHFPEKNVDKFIKKAKNNEINF